MSPAQSLVVLYVSYMIMIIGMNGRLGTCTGSSSAIILTCESNYILL